MAIYRIIGNASIQYQPTSDDEVSKTIHLFFPFISADCNIILISDEYIPDNSIKQGKFQQQDKRELTSLNLYGGGLHGEIEGEIENGSDDFGGDEYFLDDDYEVNYCILFLSSVDNMIIW